jgi:Fe-S-cluster containining protein
VSGERWYEDGLRFACQACGSCCRDHSEYCYVYLTSRDVAAAAAHLGCTEDQVLEGYSQLDGGRPTLTSRGGDCVFLEEGRCGIYPARPKQCATWPFWRENLVEEVWHGPVAECCPGIGSGRLWSADEIDEQASERERWYGYRG